ncbi:MAG: alpha-E domain-containing protein [Synergistaceae bacterium]|nr:alpha-E domain-containing protein [Synergistaceae bacterium]
MSVLSRENCERLFWLGRYSERVYTGLRDFMEKFDAMTGSPSAGEYAKHFCFDSNNPDSVSFSLMRAYDNAIVLRDETGTETFSYIQLAVYEMKNAAKSAAPLLPLQKVIDNIAAFWGMADDRIEDEKVRGIIKLGKRIERVDLYARMNADKEDIRREVRRLSYRIGRAGLSYSTEGLSRINALAECEEIDRAGIVREVEALITFAE